MKRISCLVFLALALLSASGCAGVFVSSPLAEQLGFRAAPITVTITNNTPLYGRILIYDREVGVIGPGDVAYGKRYFEPLWPDVPVLVLFYEDEALTKYVGVAGRVFKFSGYYGGEVYSWQLESYDIELPDGRYATQGELPETELRTTRIVLPREWWNATVGVQVVNNTTYTANLRLNGMPAGTLETGEVVYIKGQTFYNRGYVGQDALLQVMFTGDSRLVGTAEYYFAVPQWDVWAYQFILHTADIRTPR